MSFVHGPLCIQHINCRNESSRLLGVVFNLNWLSSKLFRRVAGNYKIAFRKLKGMVNEGRRQGRGERGGMVSICHVKLKVSVCWRSGRARSRSASLTPHCPSWMKVQGFLEPFWNFEIENVNVLLHAACCCIGNVERCSLFVPSFNFMPRQPAGFSVELSAFTMELSFFSAQTAHFDLRVPLLKCHFASSCNTGVG